MLTAAQRPKHSLNQLVPAASTAERREQLLSYDHPQSDEVRRTLQLLDPEEDDDGQVRPAPLPLHAKANMYTRRSGPLSSRASGRIPGTRT